MKKRLKSFISLLLAVALCFGGTVFAEEYSAVIPRFDVLVNGEMFFSNPPVLVVNDKTYLPLRALGDVLDVPVEWNEQLKRVEVGVEGKGTPTEGAAMSKNYAMFDDVPDFEKITGAPLLEETREIVSVGVLHHYLYDASTATEEQMNVYFSAIEANGFENIHYEENEDGSQISVGFLNSEGRMFNLTAIGDYLGVSVVMDKHTLEEWEAIDTGKMSGVKDYQAVVAGFPVLVNGAELAITDPILVVDGRTYLPLRAMGDVLGVSVKWNTEIGRVEVGETVQK